VFVFISKAFLKVKGHIQLMFHVFECTRTKRFETLGNGGAFMNKAISFSFADMPIVTLKMGSSLNPDDIKEGADVYFECLILSNPKPYKMSWFHNVSFCFDSRRRAFEWSCENANDFNCFWGSEFECCSSSESL
jgi:hypothetical protein